MKAKKLQPVKVEAIEAAKKSFEGYSDFIFADYRGLTVEQITALRRQLREKNCEFKVVKNNFAKIAFNELKVENVADYLVGPTAVALAKDDANEIAKIMFDFAKDAPALIVKGASIDNTIYDQAKIEAYSKLPGKTQLITMIACALNSTTQKFAATYRIPLISFERLPFWKDFCKMFGTTHLSYGGRYYSQRIDTPEEITEEKVISFANEIGQRMAVAITGSGQLLFLYRQEGEKSEFDDFYSLHWSAPNSPWVLLSGDCSYLFHLPKSIMKQWLENATNDLEMKREAINCKASFLSNMIVYYAEYGRPMVKMISIDRYQLENALKELSYEY